VCVVTLEGTEARISGVDTKSEHIGKFGAISKYFKKNKCSHICFAGVVKRPDFSQLKPDWAGFKALPRVIAAARHGDDALLSHLLAAFESQGFEIIAPQKLCANILMPEGFLGAVEMSKEHRSDSEKACRIAREIGSLDIGQGAIVCRGLVLAVEAQEGTDAMLQRAALLPPALIGSQNARAGVLAKMVKPGQERRVDLPTIGLRTVELAAKAGLAGIVVEGKECFVLERDNVIAAADKYGLFIAGLPSAAPRGA
jgi:DUF1009 family protein